MKIIRCPSCGKAHLNQKYCTACGCYLPPVLEEEEDMARVYFSEQLCTPNEMRAVLYADNMAIMSVSDQMKQIDEWQRANIASQLVQVQTDIAQRTQTQHILEQLQPFRPYPIKPDSQRIGWW